MQLFDDVLYSPFRATIRGAYYGVVSQDFVDEECYNLALRAISAFKFPKISTDYNTFYAVRQDDGTLKEVEPTEDGAIPHGRFLNNLTYAEIEILIAWMKVYWCENQISNADNFEDMYTDANIKTYSRANAVDKNMKLMAEYRSYARDLETRYSRINKDRKPSLGDVNEDE
jgi:hypothetical protein